MPRQKRIAKRNIVYHVLNRANGRLRIFKTLDDFEAFEQILAEGLARFSMRLCGYCIMSSHWHLVLWPRRDGELSEFMKWVAGTHSQRWHSAHKAAGVGHLYQGRYKSLPVQKSESYLTLMQYVESTPKRAGIAKSGRDWPWSSLAIRTGTEKPIQLSDGPMKLPKPWVHRVDGLDESQAQVIETCIERGRPFGDEKWVLKTASQLLLESSLKPLGRPRKEEK